VRLLPVASCYSDMIVCGILPLNGVRWLTFGQEGIMSGIITEDNFLTYFPGMEPDNKSGAVQALVVAIYEVGCLMGSIFIIAYGDTLGRRRAVLLGVIIMLVGTAIQASSFEIAQMIVGRIVTGVGNGMNTSSIPVWQSEMAPPKIRGFLVLFEGALIAAGSMYQLRSELVTFADCHSYDIVLVELRLLLRYSIRIIPMALPNRIPSSLRFHPFRWSLGSSRVPALVTVRGSCSIGRILDLVLTELKET